MCFSPSITWTTAVLGFATAILAAAKKKPVTLFVAPAYFGLMEVIQGIMYTQLHDPNTLLANFLIYLAYIHVCFQPLVINYWLGSFISKDKEAVYRFTLKLCFVGGLLLLSRMFITTNTPLCSPIESLCSATPIIFFGSHHIAWSLPLSAPGWKYVTPSVALHFFLFFIPGLFMGLYRLMITFFLLGPYLSGLITSNVSEQSSVWCVIGLWLLVITVCTTLYKPPRFLFPKK